MQNKEILLDIDGKEIAEGSFVELLETSECIIAGPYKYAGYRYGGHIWVIGDQEMFSSALSRGRLKLLNWKRWRNKRLYFDRFEAWYQFWREGLLISKAA